ncbi:type II inositol 3,4-bisphosphate 4-phosphatase isoform X5 [Hippoglossus hippoglossus]|uniref:type II inositol 3,4-bisphosphate 4-phosphatase isoform X5 n=1 Tax=Hippoglossus hippoglossus TaxID=8267 RepID=UPI00148E2DF2|nr:type II inositol 3,4-bisphosphate 4-phosphatase isoform X5 [Hippoglossus hippoglossus]XP_047197884.1 type II inositol 3,4-bisphosphate 4-phosphatase isoform X3 [Hippoglossus stenolepis]
MEDGIQHLGHCMVDMKELSADPEGLIAAGVILTPKLPQVELSLACNDLVASGRDRKPNALVQVAVIDPHQQHLVTQACTEIVEANKDPLFLTGVTFPSEYPASPETLVKLTVYDSKDKSQESSNFLGSATFSVGDLLRAKDERLTLSLRSSDGVCAAGTVVVSRLKMGEMEEVDVDHITTDIPPQKCPLVCDSASHACVDRENYPLTGPVFKNPVCKVYRFQTMDSKWMLVREQMEECTLSFSIPRQLLSLYIQQDMNRVQDLRELGELSPHWDNLRKEVMARYGGIIGYYQETLAELDKITGRSFKPSCCKAQKSLEFIPINLHTQRMRVTCPRKTDAFYDIVTVGAPAAHFQGFKCGGLQRLLSRYEAEKKSFSTAYQCIYYSPEHTAKAQEVLSTVSLLQPLITSSADQLLQAAQERSSTGLKDVLKKLSDKTEQFVHTLKDELVKSALLALHAAQPGYVSKNQKPTPAQAGQHQGHVHQCSEQNPSPVQGLPGHSPATSVTESTVMCNNVDGSQTTTKGEGGTLPLKHQDSIPHHKEYDEEEWDRVWANVAKCLNCVIAMVDKLQEEDNNRQEPVPEQQLADVITSHNPGDWKEQLCPLVTRLKDCVMEVVGKAKRAMTFVLLQEAACSIPQGFLLQQRRDVVFSQALAALACGFVMRLYAGMEDKGFLRQLQLVGLVAQFESLLSTYSEEIGMLEDMEVGISDLQRVVFKITEAKTDDLSDLQPLVCGRRDHFTVEVPLPRLVFQTLPEEIKEGKPLQVFPVLFNVGINEQQTIAERFGDISLQERINQKNFEMLEAYYKSLSEKVPLECLPCFQTQTDVKELLETLGQNVVTKKRKNVEILWIAGSICRRLNGIRFTSCKSAKDRTSMSVTLEQCALLRDEHQLSKDCFIRALDCMRSRLTQGDIGQWEDPEAGAVTENKPASRHFYPIALLLVSSHLLVVWLILSLVFLLAKYQ